MSSKLSFYLFFLACLMFVFLGVDRMPKNLYVPSRKAEVLRKRNVVYKTSQTTLILCVSYERPSLLPNVRQKFTLHKKVYVSDTVKRDLWSGPNYTIVHDSAYSDKHHFRTISGLATNVLGNRKLFSGLVPVYVG